MHLRILYKWLLFMNYLMYLLSVLSPNFVIKLITSRSGDKHTDFFSVSVLLQHFDIFSLLLLLVCDIFS